MMGRAGWLLAIILTVALLPAGVLAADETTPPAATSGGGEMMHGHQHMKGKMDPKTAEECKAREEKMAADMKAMDERLNAKVTAMNAAKGQQKSDAMAAVINELVSQRKEMREKMRDLHHDKLCGMMGSGMMGSGMMGGGRMCGGMMGGMGREGMEKGEHKMEMHHPTPSDQGGAMKKEGAT
jgi:hypothetical protein